MLGRKEDYVEYLDGESANDYVHKDKIRNMIKELEEREKTADTRFDRWEINFTIIELNKLLTD